MMMTMKLFRASFLVAIVAVISAQSSQAQTEMSRTDRIISSWTAEEMNSAIELAPLFGEGPDPDVYIISKIGELDKFVLFEPVPGGRRQLDSRELQTVLEPANGSTIDNPRAVTFKTSLTAEQAAAANLALVYVSPADVETAVPVLPETEMDGTTVTEIVGGFTDGTWTWYVKGTDADGTEVFTSTENSFTVTANQGRRLQATIGLGDWGGPGLPGGVSGGQVQSATGRIFFRTNGGNSSCSGTAMKDHKTNRTLILTAAHCIQTGIGSNDADAWGYDVVFVPDRDATSAAPGAGRVDDENGDTVCSLDPCGCWAIAGGVVLQDYYSRTEFAKRVPWDYGVYVVEDEGAHRGPQCNPDSTALDKTVDVMRFLAEPTEAPVVSDYIYSLGYQVTYDPDNSAIVLDQNKFEYCAEIATTKDFSQIPGTTWWLSKCELGGGSSGGPWVQNMNTADGSGDIVAVNSFGTTTTSGMGAAIVDQGLAECLVNAARNVPIEDFGTTERLEGVIAENYCQTRTDDVELTSTFTPPETASTSGDPHFKTWTGDKFDYHGECDLVLIDNPRFNKGQGLKLHIRTTRVGYYSYIERIAVQIGDDVLEFANDIEKSRLNGEKLPEQRKKHRDYFAGFYLRRDKKALSLRLDNQKKGGPRIEFIRRKNGFPAVVVDGGNNSSIFDGSMGLLGEHGTGLKLGRDGFTNYGSDKDATAFALEWQVRDTEPMLFSEARFPQFPAQCVPPQKMMISRLGMARARQAAEKACAHWKEDKEDCIFDAIATRDMAVAAEGSITSRSAVVA